MRAPRGGIAGRAGVMALLGIVAGCMYGGNPADLLAPTPQAELGITVQVHPGPPSRE